MKTQQQQQLGEILTCIPRAGLILIFLWLLAAATIHRVVAADVRTHEINQSDPHPLPKKTIRIRYPSSVRKHGGEVTLKFLVTKAGRVENITVVKFSDPDMIEPVYSAYEKAVFTPGLKNGAPVDTWLTVTEKAE